MPINNINRVPIKKNSMSCVPQWHCNQKRKYILFGDSTVRLIFSSPMNHSSNTVAGKEIIYFFGGDIVSIEFFLRPMYHSSTVVRFSSVRVESD